MLRWMRFVTVLCSPSLVVGALPPSVVAQEISCKAAAAVDYAGVATLSEQQVHSWAAVHLTTGSALAEELRAYGVQMSEFSSGGLLQDHAGGTLEVR